jgi:hypothetical protein
VFPLSTALTDFFLPVRKEDFRQYLLTAPTNVVQFSAMMLPAKTVSAQAISTKSAPAKTAPVVKSGKRSG